MRLFRMIIGLVLIAVGAVFTLQGIGVLPGSAMTGVALWAVVGPVVALMGLVLVLTARKRDPRP